MKEKNSSIKFHFTTLRLLQEANHEDESIKEKIMRIYDKLARTAPEILDKTAWQQIYVLCKHNFTDMTNNVHTKCFDIYTERIELFKNL